jgi:hypothetical protein
VIGHDLRLRDKTHAEHANKRSDNIREECRCERLIRGPKCMRDE